MHLYLWLFSFWRHPFTAEDPLVSKWHNAKSAPMKKQTHLHGLSVYKVYQLHFQLLQTLFRQVCAFPNHVWICHRLTPIEGQKHLTADPTKLEWSWPKFQVSKKRVWILMQSNYFSSSFLINSQSYHKPVFCFVIIGGYEYFSKALYIYTHTTLL